MVSPEQPTDQGSQTVETTESEQALHQVIQILKATAEQFNTLDQEAATAILRRDTKDHLEKLKAKGQLLIDLPDLLTSSLEEVELETRQLILDSVSYFATSARGVLQDENVFGLGVLLTHMGRKIGDKNDLEELINSLESK